jgi:hypothetical protein
MKLNMFLEKTPFHTRQKGVLYLRTRTIGLTLRLLVWSKTNAMNWLILQPFTFSFLNVLNPLLSLLLVLS